MMTHQQHFQPTTTTTKRDTTKPPTTTTTRATTTTTKSTPKPPNDGLFCSNQSNGIYPHEHCDKFYECYDGNTVAKNCAPGLHYNPSIQGCDWPANAAPHNPNCNSVI